MRLTSRSALIATALTVAAAAAPSAQAMGLLAGAGRGAVAAQHAAETAAAIHGYGEFRPSAVRIGAPKSTSSVGTPERLICTPRSVPVTCRAVSTAWATTAAPSLGFQYDDAAIGAGVMSGLLLLGTAGTLVVRQRGRLGVS
jgi:hypothetical protein